jgi:hypothetical protein
VKDLNEIEAGWDAYGNDGQKIGSIYEARQEYVVVEKGLIFPKDIYVPTDAVERADANEQRVYLNVAKDDVESMGWDEPAGAGRDPSGETWESRRDRSRDRDGEPAGTMATKRTRYGDDEREHGAEVAGGGMGAVGGAVVGGAVAGPPGALAGGAIGGGVGAGAGDKAEEKAEDEADDR